MRRQFLAVLLGAIMAVPPSCWPPGLPPLIGHASAQDQDPAAKEAFEAARTLGTVDAWQAFLARYRTGFYPDLARAYLKKLAESGLPADAPAPVQPRSVAGPPPAPAGPAARSPGQTPPGQAAAPAAPAAAAQSAPPTAGAAGPARASHASASADVPSGDPGQPAVARGGGYMSFAERFNRYYTDPTWKPSTTIYVSPDGRGDGSSREKPAPVPAAIARAKPGTLIHFTRGAYRGCFELTRELSGTYDQPIVLYAERKEDRSLGVTISCCGTGRQTCFNLEDANYVAIDGFELVGGRFGVRVVGAGYPASEHSRGVAVIDCDGHDQNNDAFFSGQADWVVWERNRGSNAGPGDGHGLYISNGSDWNIVRFNETFNNPRSDFQVNASPNETCKETGIPVDDARCDAYAGEGEGGQGASDYLLVDSNYFHHNPGPGVNFTSVRRSLIRNNIFGFNTRHNVSFWQETDNPKLGSRENRILHNLFVSTGRQGVQFTSHSTRNEFANNVVVGILPNGAGANPSAVLMEVDGTVGENVYRDNLYASGRFEGYGPNDRETVIREFSPAWFGRFPNGPNHDPNDLRPAAGAPFLARGARSPYAAIDRYGAVRTGPVDLGPIAAGSAIARPASQAAPAPATPLPVEAPAR